MFNKNNKVNFLICIFRRLQTKVTQVTRNSKFTQNGISYHKAFLLHVLLKNVYQGVYTKRHKCYTFALLCKSPL